MIHQTCPALPPPAITRHQQSFEPRSLGSSAKGLWRLPGVLGAVHIIGTAIFPSKPFARHWESVPWQWLVLVWHLLRTPPINPQVFAAACRCWYHDNAWDHCATSSFEFHLDFCNRFVQVQQWGQSLFNPVPNPAWISKQADRAKNAKAAESFESSKCFGSHPYAWNPYL